MILNLFSGSQDSHNIYKWVATQRSLGAADPDNPCEDQTAETVILTEEESKTEGLPDEGPFVMKWRKNLISMFCCCLVSVVSVGSKTSLVCFRSFLPSMLVVVGCQCPTWEEELLDALPCA